MWPVSVGGDHRIADASQRDAEYFASLTGALLSDPRCFAENDDQSASEKICNETDHISRDLQDSTWPRGSINK